MTLSLSLSVRPFVRSLVRSFVPFFPLVSLKSVAHLEGFKEGSCVFQGSLKGVLRKFKVCFKKVSSKFKGVFKEV